MEPALIDEIIGSYRVTRVLGEGGMGRVYLAQHSVIGKLAAIKVLLPQYSAQPEIVNRFFNEARASSMLKHPGVIDVYDFGTLPSGSAFLVMEFLEGETLAARIRKVGRMSSSAIVDVARQAANALAAAHGRGIVHRDLKPENMFLVPDPETRSGERTKILDFGIAKLSDAQSLSNAQATRTGALIGTPTYMSPEQCRGAGHVDHRSDIYSLGCVMFEMATGRAPFEGNGPGEIIGAHLFHAPPSLAGQVPDGLAELVARMLVKSPDERLQSMAELGASLERLAGRISDPAQGQSPAVLATRMMPAVAMPASEGQDATGERRVPTTLGGATGEVGVAEVARRAPAGGVKVLGAALGAAVLLGGVLLWRPWHSNVSKTPTAAVAQVEPPKVEPPKVEPPKMAKPATASVHIVSEPAGAEVYRDSSKVGLTPYSMELATSDETIVYRLHAKGYRDSTVTVHPRGVVEKIVTLDKAPSSSGKKAGPVKNGVLDPFAH